MTAFVSSFDILVQSPSLTPFKKINQRESRRAINEFKYCTHSSQWLKDKFEYPSGTAEGSCHIER